MLDKNCFLDSLRGRYKDEVKMLVCECTSDWNTYLDIDKLSQKLQDIYGYAREAGLSYDDWIGIVFEVAPEVYDQLYGEQLIAA